MTTPAAPQCEVWQVDCQLQEVAAEVLTDTLARLAVAVGDAVGAVLTSLSTLWVDIGTPNLTTSGNNPSDAVAFIQGSLWWYMATAAVLSVTVGGARMAWERRAEPGRDVLRSLMTLAVVSGSGLAVIALAVQAADAFAEWIIDRSTVGTDFGENLGALLLTPLITPTAVGDGLPALLVIVLGVAGIVTSCVQIILMIVRSGMLVILAGIFPLSAAFTTTETGRTWFRRCCAWLLAFILYKPAAAIVYATAFRLSGADLFGDEAGAGMLDVLVGVTMMVLAILALPALMRFVTPAVGIMAASSSGAGAGLAVAAMGAMPSGAAFARSGRSGAAGSSGPSGSRVSAGSGSSQGASAARPPSEPSGAGAAGSASRGGATTSGATTSGATTSATGATAARVPAAAAAAGGPVTAAAVTATRLTVQTVNALKQSADSAASGADGGPHGSR
ncbi:hypothetical protein [Aquipuribacter sp. SD81]|uniref:hypothetical protein n=1 Tax=Aquipuribacter sp. SD81 TaxID=3127703 RepID=UPI003017D78C